MAPIEAIVVVMSPWSKWEPRINKLYGRLRGIIKHTLGITQKLDMLQLNKIISVADVM